MPRDNRYMYMTHVYFKVYCSDVCAIMDGFKCWIRSCIVTYFLTFCVICLIAGPGGCIQCSSARTGELTKDIELCLICQKRTHEETRYASSAGRMSVKDASLTRTKFHCDAYIYTIDMLNSNTHVLNNP